MKNIYVFAFATFGDPNDFRQSPFICDEQSFAQKIKIFDLTNAIKVFPDSTIYAIRKEIVNEILAISYSIYTYAKEQYSSRKGTFIGSSITYSNGVAEEEITITKLLTFHNALIRNNTNNNILSVNHSKDFNIPVSIISNFITTDFCFKDVNIGDHVIGSTNNIIVYSRIDKNTLYNNFKDSLELLYKYDSIYFTDNKDVISHSRERNIYLVVDENGFKNEIINIQNELKRKAKGYILELEREKTKWAEEINKLIYCLEGEININKNLPHQNKIIINDLISRSKIICDDYLIFSEFIDDCIRQLKSGKALGKVSARFIKEKNKFANWINDAERTSNIKIIKQN